MFNTTLHYTVTRLLTSFVTTTPTLHHPTPLFCFSAEACPLLCPLPAENLHSVSGAFKPTAILFSAEACRKSSLRLHIYFAYTSTSFTSGAPERKPSSLSRKCPYAIVRILSLITIRLTSSPFNATLFTSSV